MNNSDPNPASDPAVDLDAARISADFVALVHVDSAWRNRFCAVTLEDDTDLLVVTDDTPASIIARISEQLPRQCSLLHVSDERVCRLIARAYDQSRST
ncbi:MAG: hypothetical protein J0L78_08950 [Planctomycetes bacterium]|nr:hypothetical protein [Planctomycetota bacterium]